MSDEMTANRPEEKGSPPAASGAPVPFSGTVTIFFSDIRGFTDYTEQFGDEAAYRVLSEHNAIVRRQIDAFGGVVVKTQGDSFMVAFTTARGAIQCAIAVQRAVAEANPSQSGPRIAIGIGINTGEPIQEGGDYFGSMVNLAARICAAAGPGQILVAETTRYVAGRIEGVRWVDRGLHELKGFAEAKRLSEVAWRQPAAAEPAAGGASPVAEQDIAELVAAVQRAIGVLNRVLAVSHMDDQAFGPLLECQAKAGELRLALSRAISERRDIKAKQVLEAILPFENLVTLILEGRTLSEERWAQLEGNVARTFGRPLVTAAARGRLALAAVEEREAAAVGKQPEAPAPPRVPVVQAYAPRPPDPRAAGVRWWAAAYGAWSQWKLSGVAWAHALRAELAKYPHLLSVHLRASSEHDDGLLAGGYFLLLEHAENQSPSLMSTILERAIEAGGGSLDPGVLGPRLYQLLAECGRLRDTYMTFVRDIIGTAIPNPGVWPDGGIVEHEDATVVVTRPTETIGETDEHLERLTEPKDRVLDRRFEATLLPLTTRFFYVKPGELKLPRDVEVRLTSHDEPSDRAMYLTLKTSLLVRSEPRVLPKPGVSLPDLGRDNAGVWVAVFNPEPEEIVTYELTVGVKQPNQSPPKGSGFTRPGPRR